jgi:signal transduction histidine kinase
MWQLSPDFLKTEPHVSEILEQARPLLDVTTNWGAFKTQMTSYALDRTPRSVRLELKDETLIDLATVPLPDGSVLNSYLDVTDSSRVEQALRASNAALATADRLKSDFVANVSYQLRTPLNTIMGFADILAEQYFGKLNDRQLEYTMTIKSESEKLSRLINDVLDLATIEAGRMTLDCHAISVAAVLNEAKLMTAAWARQQMIDVLIDCPSDIGTMEADEHRVKQILFNLISNAIKYTPAGGNIALAAWKQEEWVVISVLDTGVGIPESDRERVFGKFEKSNLHLRQSGAGLGLSLVKSFVELHGGRVEIFSDDKDGTRISCFFPVKAQSKIVPSKAAGV